MKTVLISIRPKWSELIANAIKTIEVRKTKPKCETPFKCYIYCTKERTLGDFVLCKSKELTKLFGQNVAKGIKKGLKRADDIDLKGKVIGEFVCNKVELVGIPNNPRIDINVAIKSCLGLEDVYEYNNGKKGYAWHISDLKIYNKPKELGEFNLKKSTLIRKNQQGYESVRITRPPQSWCYVEELII